MTTQEQAAQPQATADETFQTFSIRDLCEAFDVTPRALRFYEAQGLLSPQREGQRRIYSVRDRARLKLVLRGKRFGFTLAETREHLDLYDLGDGQRTQLRKTLTTAAEKLRELEDKRRDVDEAIEELKAQMKLVQSMVEGADDSQDDDGRQERLDQTNVHALRAGADIRVSPSATGGPAATRAPAQ